MEEMGTGSKPRDGWRMTGNGDSACHWQFRHGDDPRRVDLQADENATVVQSTASIAVLDID